MAADLTNMLSSLRPLANARVVRPGTDDPIVKMQACPDCRGWGWRCVTPFAEFNRKFVQCPTCEDAKRHFDEHGTLPADIAAAMGTRGVMASDDAQPKPPTSEDLDRIYDGVLRQFAERLELRPDEVNVDPKTHPSFYRACMHAAWLDGALAHGVGGRKP